VLEPEETEGRGRFFLERIVSGIPGVDLNRPIRIEQLARALERRQGERSEGSGERRESNSSSAGSAQTAAPLVPGFGVDLQLPPVPGFGSDEAVMLVKVEEQDRRMAEDRLRRYDRNGDGYLSKEELAEGRWSDDPFQYDRNRDGKLSVDELAMRYAKRRMAESSNNAGSANTSKTGSRSSSNPPPQKFYIPPSSTSSTSSSGSGSSRGSGGAARSGRSASESGGDERVLGMVQGLIRRWDADGDGKLSRDEWQNLPFDVSGFDTNHDGVLDQNEIAEAISSRGFFGFSRGRGEGEGRGGGFFGGWPGGPGFGGAGGPGRGGPDGGPGRGDGGRDRRGERDVQRANTNNADTPRFFVPQANTQPKSSASEASGTADAANNQSLTAARLTAKQRLQQSDLGRKLPEWFFRSDQDEDGQVAMHEFSKEWSEQVVADFFKFDVNQDGFITAAECAAAIEQGVTRSGALASSSTASQPETRAAPADGSSRSGRSRSSGGFFTRRSDAPRSQASEEPSAASSQTPQESTSESAAAADGAAAGAASGEPSAEGAAASVSLDDLPAAYVSYARGIIAKYDANHNGVLDKSEWSAVAGNPEKADLNGDGVITLEEYARFVARR